MSGMRIVGLYGADLSFITKLGQDSNMLSVGVMLLVDGELAAGLQLFLGMDNANVIDDGNFLLGIPQDKGPHPVKAMAYTTSTGNVQISQRPYLQQDCRGFLLLKLSCPFAAEHSSVKHAYRWCFYSCKEHS